MGQRSSVDLLSVEAFDRRKRLSEERCQKRNVDLIWPASMISDKEEVWKATPPKAGSQTQCAKPGWKPGGLKLRESNRDVWWTIRRALAERGFRVFNVKSHRPGLIGTPSLTVEGFAVNHHQDFFADEAAAEAQLPQQAVNSVVAVVKVAWQLMKRLLAIVRQQEERRGTACRSQEEVPQEGDAAPGSQGQDLSAGTGGGGVAAPLGSQLEPARLQDL